MAVPDLDGKFKLAPPELFKLEDFVTSLERFSAPEFDD
jgi:hypothetical protein